MAQDVSQYDDRMELADYLWHNYGRFYSDNENLAARTLLAEQKMASPNMSQSMRRVMQRGWVSRGNPEVDRLLTNGATEFKIRAAERVMETHANELFVNRCGLCGQVVATPRAKQCLWCGHDWHSESNGT